MKTDVVRYGADGGGVVHSFTNPDADKLGRPDVLRYDAAADRRSWDQMRALLAEVFA